MAAEVVVKNSIDAEEIEAVSDISRGIENLNIKSKHYDLLLPDGNAYESLLMKEVAINVVSYMLNKRVEIKTIKELLPKPGWLQSTEEFREGQKISKDVRYADRRNVINGGFYLSNQWTAQRFAYFKERLNERFPEIRISLHESD